METGDITRKLVSSFLLFLSLNIMMHSISNVAYLLPLIIGESCWMQSSKSLILVLDDSSIIAWGIRCVKLIAKHGRHGILRKESITKTFTAGAVTCGVDSINNIFCGFTLHP